MRWLQNSPRGRTKRTTMEINNTDPGRAIDHK